MTQQDPFELLINNTKLERWLYEAVRERAAEHRRSIKDQIAFDLESIPYYSERKPEPMKKKAKATKKKTKRKKKRKTKKKAKKAKKKTKKKARRRS